MEIMGIRLPFAHAFRARSVFVTGHTGFKGSWLSIWLSKLGARVTGYSLGTPTVPSNFVASRVKDLLSGHYEADVRDADRLLEALRASRPDVIVHLAAQALVREGYANPRETFDVNLMGTASLLDGIREMGSPCVVVIVTSDKCYENREDGRGYREDDPMGGNDPYSASKAAAEILTAAYRRAFFDPIQVRTHGVKVASARAGNVIGGGDWSADRIVVDMVKALSSKRAVPVRNPDSIRPWQHVLESASGYLTLAARLLSDDDPGLCSAWNFGPAPGQEAKVRDLVEVFCRAWGSGQWRVQSDPEQHHEARALRLCTEKATEKLGWRPRWSLSQAVERTCRWYRAFYVDPDRSMQGACLEDIADYEAEG